MPNEHNHVISPENLKRVLIIHTDGNSFNNPTLKCIIDLILEKGYQIDLRYPKSLAPMPFYEGVRFLPFGKQIKRIKIVFFNLFCSRLLAYLSVIIENISIYKHYDLIIGVDRQGLVEANILNRLTGTPYIFISFEIMFATETSLRYKFLEKKASKNVSAWIIQDETRAKQAQIENDLDPNKKILLPLASAGIGKLGHNRLRDSLGIPSDKKVAILIGSLSNWTMTDQVLSSISKWPDDWVLIIHDRYGNTYKSLKTHNLTHFFGHRIYISNAATKLVDDLGDILSGINAGLAFYQPVFGNPYTGKNLEILGLASGKISSYLRYGIPVIVNKIGTYADEIHLHRLGFVIDHPEQIPEILPKLIDQEFSINTRDYFLHYLDFNLYHDFIWGEISSVIKNAQRQ